MANSQVLLAIACVKSCILSEFSKQIMSSPCDVQEQDGNGVFPITHQLILHCGCDNADACIHPCTFANSFPVLCNERRAMQG